MLSRWRAAEWLPKKTNIAQELMVTDAAALGYDRTRRHVQRSKETCAMGDKSPKSTAKSDKQKSQKKDAKSSKK